MLIFIFGWLLYGQTLFFDFTYFDDQSLVLENYPIVSNVKNIGEIFLNDVFLSTPKFYYRPLLNLSLMLDMNIAGTLPFIFHFSNILIHILAAGLIFGLLTKLKYQKPLAFWLALFFLFHPVLTQAVAWIPGRNDSLLTVFVLAAFLFFLNFLDQPRLRDYLGYLFFLLLALFTKETAIFLPILIIFYFLVVAPKKSAASDRWLLVGGSLVVGVVWFILRSLALEHDPVTLKIVTSTILKNAPALLVIIGKTLWPFNLAVLPILADAKIIYGLIVTPLLILALFFSRQKNYRHLVFGLAWFVLFLLPSFVRLNPVDTPDFLEHRLYLPFIGFLIILAEIDWLKNLNWPKKTVKIGATLVLIGMAFLVFRHSLSFKDRLTFWQSAVATAPHSALAHRNLGAMYYLADNFAAAEKQYHQALALNEREAMAHNNLGVIYLSQKRYVQATKEFQQELAVNPNYDKALFNLGDLAYRQKDYLKAAEYFRAALKVNPRYGEAYEYLLILQNQLR